MTLLFSLLILPSSILQLQGWIQPLPSLTRRQKVGRAGTLHISQAGPLYSAPTSARSLFCWTLTNIPHFANEETEAQRGPGLAVSHTMNAWQGWLQNSCLLTMSNKICPPAHSDYSFSIPRLGVLPNLSTHLGRGGAGILGGTSSGCCQGSQTCSCHRR